MIGGAECPPSTEAIQLPIIVGVPRGVHDDARACAQASGEFQGYLRRGAVNSCSYGSWNDALL